MKLDLGFKSPSYGSIPKEPEEDPVHYPELTLRDECADKLARKVDVDDIVTATVKMRVTGIHSRSEKGGGPFPMGSTLDLEVMSMTDVQFTGEPADEKEMTAEEAADEYRAEKDED